MLAVVHDHMILHAHPWRYLLLLLIFTVVIKEIMAVVRVIQINEDILKGFWKNVWSVNRLVAKGILIASWKCSLRVGYLVPSLVGTLELAIYPVLISLGAWQAIGGWLAIKTAAAWRWQGDKQDYTNFLFGNALVIFFAFLLACIIKM